MFARSTVFASLVLLSFGSEGAAQEMGAPGGTQRRGTAQGEAVAPSDVAARGEPSDEQLEAARAAFREGVRILQQDPIDYAAAYAYFSRASRLSGNWKVLGNLGLCAFHLERYDEALDHYASYLSQGGSEVSEDERASVEMETATILKESGVVTFGIPEPVEVVDVRAGSRIAPQKYQLSAERARLRLRVGEHHLIFRFAGGRPVDVKLEVSSGAHLSRDIERASEPPPPAPAPSEVADPGMSATRSWGIGVAGLGAATLVVSMSMGFVAAGFDRHAWKQCRRNEEDQMVCELTAQQDFESAESYTTAANVLWIAGGITALAGLGMIIWGGDESSEARAVRVSPLLGRDFEGLTLSGRF